MRRNLRRPRQPGSAYDREREDDQRTPEVGEVRDLGMAAPPAR